ncbi:hypothetical protein FF80_00726 [Devosia sp. LC5]|uniref:hypothetical protein n=1 Tax=Devosia sp. LC5 TaxID=1502724 RepID=UPI0004E36849|nr:hypothetical protein [Devosia sp. LC5]KFC71008.1 hypothetical protein FF80_00726 [Devosia sp. LC5]
MNKIITVVFALALTATPSVAATYTLKITNNGNSEISRIWVTGGTVEGRPCAPREDVCVKTITLPDGVCRADLTVTGFGRGRARTYVNWCASGGTVEMSVS